MDAFEVVIVQSRIVREQGGQDVFDRIRTLHGAGVVPALPEGDHQILDVIVNVHQVIRQVWIQRRQSLDAAFFKAHIVSRGADVQRNIPAEPLRQLPPRVLARVGQVFRVLQLAALVLNPMQRVLEGDLLEGLGIVIERDSRLEGLEVQEVQRIGQPGEEGPDGVSLDCRGLIEQFMLDLLIRFCVELVTAVEIRKGDQPLIPLACKYGLKNS